MAEKVLVIEDDQEINELLGEYLGLEGIGYTSALDGTTGLARAAAEEPDAVILDIMLPDIDGYEVCRQLASHRPTATVPVIMLTCMNQDSDCRKGLASGAFQYMSKPFLPDDLIQRLRDAFLWRHHLPQRPPAGQVEINSENPRQALHGVNEMIADLYTRSTLPDAQIGQIREAFHILLEWAARWAATQAKPSHLLVHYRLTTANQLADNGRPADQIEWVVSELQPGMLAETLFAVTPSLHGGGPFGLTADAPKPGETAQPSTLTPWYQFLAKCGIAKFEKDTKIAHVRLLRNLNGEAVGIPVVCIDGTRLPTRLRSDLHKPK